MKRWKKLLTVLYLVPAFGWANQGASAELIQKTLAGIHRTNLAEIELGKLAVHRGQSERVRRYGDRLVRDHRMADRKLLTLAKERGLSLLGLSVQVNQELEDLRAVPVAEFDAAFLQAMAQGHQKDIGDLRLVLSELPESEARVFVERILPILEQHQNLAHNQMKKERVPWR